MPNEKEKPKADSEPSAAECRDLLGLSVGNEISWAFWEDFPDKLIFTEGEGEIVKIEKWGDDRGLSVEREDKTGMLRPASAKIFLKANA